MIFSHFPVYSWFSLFFPAQPHSHVPSPPTLLGIGLLAEIKRNVLVPDHMTNLTLHGDGKEDAKVDEENGPKDGDVQELKEGADHADDDGTGS